MAKRNPNAQLHNVLEAASELIVHYGFDKTTMEDIARRVGMSKAALYLRWESKQALLDSLLAFEMKRVLLDFRHRVDEDTNGGQIANMYKHTLLALQANPFMSAVYMRDSRVLGDFVSRQNVSRYADRLLLGKTLVATMQSAGLLRADLTSEAISYIFSIIAVGFVYIHTILPTGEAPPLPEIANAIASMMESGLARGEGSSATGKQTIVEAVELMIRQYDEELIRSAGRISVQKGTN